MDLLDSGPEEADPTTFTVSELTGAVRDVVRQALPSEVWVQGETARITRHRNGNVYFDLVEPSLGGRRPRARIGVVLMQHLRPEVNEVLRSAGAGRMDEGVQLRIRGRLDVYAGNGQVQLLMTGVDPAYTVGQMAIHREALLRRLSDEDLLAANGRTDIPLLPLRVGLVTSVGSAAHGDVTHELERSGIGFTVSVADAVVQGPGAARAVTDALATLAAVGVDLIIVARGGGARADLMAFDTEMVARAIAVAPVPVFTGIGHEVDTTVADEVAHSAFKTPTACAASVVARASAAVGRLEDLAEALTRVAAGSTTRADARAEAHATRIQRLVEGHLSRAGHRLDRAEALVHRDARHGLSTAQTRLDRVAGAVTARAGAHLRSASRRHAEATTRLIRHAELPVHRADTRLQVAAARASALDPERALARGWSITKLSDGTLVRGPEDAAPGSVLHTTTAGGVLVSTVGHSGAVAPANGPATPAGHDDGATPR